MLWALADPQVSRQVEAAHHAAVARALTFIETHAALTRTGPGGLAQVDTHGLTVALFDHRDSRSGDPNLHTHAAVSTKVRGLDGKWRSLDGRVLFALAVAASETYNWRSALTTLDPPGRGGGVIGDHWAVQDVGCSVRGAVRGRSCEGVVTGRGFLTRSEQRGSHSGSRRGGRGW